MGTHVYASWCAMFPSWQQMRPSSSLESAFRTHLQAASGYYNHLLVKLQAEFSLKVDGVIDFFHHPEPRAGQSWCPHPMITLAMTVHCLFQLAKVMWPGRRTLTPRSPTGRLRPATDASSIWVILVSGSPEGILPQFIHILCSSSARYQQDYDGVPSRVLAQRYYYQALALCPSAGLYISMPSLYLDRYFTPSCGFTVLNLKICTVLSPVWLGEWLTSLVFCRLSKHTGYSLFPKLEIHMAVMMGWNMSL